MRLYCLVGLVVMRPPQERKIPGLNPACAGIFSGSSHTSDLKIGTPVATLPGAWRYRVSTGTGRPGVSILWLGEVERLIWNFYLNVAARKIVWADPSPEIHSHVAGTLSNQQTNIDAANLSAVLIAGSGIKGTTALGTTQQGCFFLYGLWVTVECNDHFARENAAYSTWKSRSCMSLWGALRGY